jgi:hypothetical protein
MNANDSLKKFRDNFCPDLSFDDERLFYRLVEEMAKLKEEKYERKEERRKR